MEENKALSDSEKPLDDVSQSKRPLPNATVTLILGIISIPFCCCYFGVISILTSVIALIVSSKDLKRYRENPDAFDRGSYKNLNAGRICAVIGLILGVIYIIGIILLFTFGFVTNFNPSTEEFQEIIKQFEELE
jgi:hypothetical protein